MTPSKQLDRLAEITRMRKQADQFKLAKLQEHAQSLRRSLEDLNAQRGKQTIDLVQAADLASIAVADLNWQIWVDQRIRKINSELAQTLAQVEECRVALRQSFGKNIAARTLQKKLKAVDDKTLKRRTSYES